MDSNFQALADRIANDVTEKVTASATQAINQHVTEVVTAAEKRLARQARVHARRLAGQAKANLEVVKAVVGGTEQRLADQAKLNVEAVKEEARVAAEGYAATLDAINGRLDRIEAKIDSKLSVHDAVLKNHNDRITALEHGPR